SAMTGSHTGNKDAVSIVSPMDLDSTRDAMTNNSGRSDSATRGRSSLYSAQSTLREASQVSRRSREHSPPSSYPLLAPVVIEPEASQETLNAAMAPSQKPEPEPEPEPEPHPGVRKSIPPLNSSRLRRSTGALFIVVIYAAIAILAWVVT